MIDEKQPELKLWSRTSDTWKRSDVVVGKDGKQYGTPVIGNADSFGYFPDKIGVNADGLADISWKMLLDSDRTRGRAAFDQTWTYSIGTAALYVQASGKAKIKNPADLTGEEAKQVVDFLIARKKAGQFRTLQSAFEEQVQLLVNRGVDIIDWWEPAVREANLKLGPDTTRYAYTVEGYFKWGHGAYIASEAKDRGNLDNIYKVLNYFMDGASKTTRAIVLALLTIPFFLDLSSRIIIWRAILGEHGLINSALLGTGMISEPLRWMLYTEPSVQFGMVVTNFPMMVLPIYLAISVIDDTLLQAATDLGASPARVLWDVVVPLSLPGVLAGIVFTLGPALAAWVEPSMLGGGFVNLLSNSVESAYTALRYPVVAALATFVIGVLALLLGMFLLAARRVADFGQVFRRLEG